LLLERHDEVELLLFLHDLVATSPPIAV